MRCVRVPKKKGHCLRNTNAHPHARKKLNRSARRTKKAKKKMKTKVRRRKKHRTEKKPLQEYTTVDDSSSEEESEDERGGMFDRQKDLRRIIPRQWPRTKLEFEQMLLAAQNSAKDAGAPVWALKNLKVLGALATHLHASNRADLKKNDRPHPAARMFLHKLRPGLSSSGRGGAQDWVRVAREGVVVVSVVLAHEGFSSPRLGLLQ
jgi:hypothetical protein